MKISKTALLTLSGVLSIAGLGLVFVSAKELRIDPSNAVQHIESVKFVSGSTDGVATMRQVGNRLVGIITTDTDDNALYNFTLSQEGSSENINNGSAGSSILGGVKNRLEGAFNVILGGESNEVNKGMYNVVLGGTENVITGGKNSSTILGGKNNRVFDSVASVIVGGSDNRIDKKNTNDGYSVIVGSNSSVDGNLSAALGENSHVDGNSSFLWTDEEHVDTLDESNVFAVVGKSGMVVGTNKAHNFAQLTLNGGLVLNEDAVPTCAGGEGGGVMRVKANGGKICLCSCDGNGWSSMFGLGECRSVCDSNYNRPDCNNSKVTKKCNDDGMNIYSGYCIKGEVLEGTGAYFVDKNNVVHRSCQTDNGEVANCSTSNVEGLGCEPVSGVCGPTHYDCIAGTSSNPNYSSTYHKYTRNCKGSYGGTHASCIEEEVINGVCAGTHYGCEVGESMNPNHANYRYTWQCKGINGGSIVDCTEYETVNGVCGETPYSCNPGNSTNNNYANNKRTWTCEGINGGLSINCEKNEVKDGRCSDPQVHYNCLIGNSINNTYFNNKWTWRCEGINGGSSASCSEDHVINGACGTSHYECTAGNSINMYEGTIQYIWTCQGINGGSSVSCTEDKVIDGACGATHYNCNAGNSTHNNQVSDNEWTWRCEGINGGTDDKTCHEKIVTPVNGACAATHYGCTAGTPGTKRETSTNYTWKCEGVNGGSDADCEESKTPQCGSVHYLCSTGTPSSESEGSAQWTWKCTNGGTTVNCSQDRPAECAATHYNCIVGASNTTSEGSTQWTWKCTNGGSTVSCSQSRSAECATTHYNCTVGTSSDELEGSTQWTWKCKNGSSTVSCSENMVVNGSCGTTYYNCTAGSSTHNAFDAGNNKWTWRCEGINGGTDAKNCNETGPECNTTHYECVKGSSINNYNGTTQYTWRCSYGGVKVNCTENKKIDGVCSQTHYNCQKGTSSDGIEGSTQWTWKCNGINGGNSVSCREDIPSVPTPINGECSDTHYGCVKGSADDKKELSDKWTWQCNGIDGGSNASCEEARAPQCGATLNTCAPGTWSDLTDSTTQYKWKCTNGSASVTCTQDKTPQCGTNVDTCAIGTYVDATDSTTQYKWECVNGSSVQCTKDKQAQCSTSHYNCLIGSSSDGNYSNHKWTWKCTNGSTSRDCSEDEDVASCGPVAGGNYSTPPTDNLCGDSSQTASSVTPTETSYKWTCTKGSSVVNCSAARLVASCGPSAGQSTSVAPSGTTNLCGDSSQTASSVTPNDTNYTWTCTKGDSTKSCSAPRLVASCGTANGTQYSSTPTQYLCGAGSTPSTVTESTTSYTWTCTRGDSTKSCSAPRLVASCGEAAGKSMNTAPSGIDNLCGDSSQTASTVTLNEATYDWTCTKGSSVVSCSANRMLASCGTANGVSTAVKPTGNLCGSWNTASTVTENDTTYTWTCTWGDSTKNCSAPRLVASCGPSAGMQNSVPPTSALCGDGSTSSEVTTNDTTFTWTCTRGSSVVNCSAPRRLAKCGSSNGGEYSSASEITYKCINSTSSEVTTNDTTFTWTCTKGVSVVNCSATRLVAGCGSSHGKTFKTKPTTNLCGDSSQDASTVTENIASYTWTCTKGSSTANCSANRVACGTANGGEYAIKPTNNLCNSVSTSSDVTQGSNTYTWKCSKDGVEVSCSATRLLASCGSANGGNYSSAPTSNLCGDTSNASSVTQTTTTYDWTCSRGDSTELCKANRVACGSANGGSYSSAPTTNLCVEGSTASTVTQSLTKFTWTCSRGSTTVSCEATRIVQQDAACGIDHWNCLAGSSQNHKEPTSTDHMYTWDCVTSTTKHCRECDLGYALDGDVCKPVYVEHPQCANALFQCLYGTPTDKNESAQTWKCVLGSESKSCSCRGGTDIEYSCPVNYVFSSTDNKCHLYYKVCATPLVCGINAEVGEFADCNVTLYNSNIANHVQLPGSKSCWKNTSYAIGGSWALYPQFINDVRSHFQRIIGAGNSPSGVYAISPYSDGGITTDCEPATNVESSVFLTSCGGELKIAYPQNEYDRGYYIDNCRSKSEWNTKDPCTKTVSRKCDMAIECPSGCQLYGDTNTCLKKCFVAGTKVAMADGTFKNIEDIKIGEKLLSESGINTVLSYYRPKLENRHLWSINGGEYFVTDEHPFKTTEGWKSFNPEMTKTEVDLDVTDLKVGDVLITVDGYEEIKTVDYIDSDDDTQLYNFVLDGDHTYYANGYLVHNKQYSYQMDVGTMDYSDGTCPDRTKFAAMGDHVCCPDNPYHEYYANGTACYVMCEETITPILPRD